MIRLFSAPDNATWPRNSSSAEGAAPQKYLPEDCSGGGGAPTSAQWYDANSTTIKRFSALCYLVAREMASPPPPVPPNIAPVAPFDRPRRARK